MIPHFHKTIHGYFSFDFLYKKMVAIHGDGAHFVEVGSWKGASSSFMAVEIANSGKKIRFDCVDTWKGSDEVPHQRDAYVVTDTLYEHFIGNMKPVEKYYNPVRALSTEAAKLYMDESLDFVYIDASHDYDNVLADIKAWLPKVKVGSWIGGHDIGQYGVRRAVKEMFPGRTFTRKGVDRMSWIIKKV